ncbi:MAG: hypothetical protein ABIJ57_09055 [Pseudomonadota bacterium]
MISEQFLGGLLWCLLVGGGLLAIFIIAALIALLFVDPDEETHRTFMGG